MLGTFFIDVNLLESYRVQRRLNPAQVAKLKDIFIHNSAIRIENPGVVIGLGEGWTQMKTDGQQMWKISKKDPHPDHLALVSSRPIGQVIWGGHCTKVIKQMAAELEKED